VFKDRSQDPRAPTVWRPGMLRCTSSTALRRSNRSRSSCSPAGHKSSTCRWPRSSMRRRWRKRDFRRAPAGFPFRTRNSELWAREKDFQKDFVAVDASGARWLVKKGVQLVGMDYLSVAPSGQSKETRRTLLEAGVVVIEGLDLSHVTQGRNAGGDPRGVRITIGRLV